MALLAGLALGIGGSVHCVAMCGPLAIAAGRRLAPVSPAAQLRHAMLYHGGRIGTYIVLGATAGIAGEILALNGFGRLLAIVSGVLLLAAAASSRVPFLQRISSVPSSLLVRATTLALRWAGARRTIGPVLVGALNGLLPCGLVYAALTAACATGSADTAAVLMAGFGLGGTPALVAIAVGAAALPAPLRLRLRMAAPLMLALAALVLIARGIAPAHSHPAPESHAALHDHR